MNAIADDTAIVLAPGEYNLTAWLDKNIGKLDAMPFNGEYPEQGLYFEDVGDGLQLDIAGYDNLCIFSKYSANPARIVCEPRHAVVLDFFNCAYVYLQGLVGRRRRGCQLRNGDDREMRALRLRSVRCERGEYE